MGESISSVRVPSQPSCSKMTVLNLFGCGGFPCGVVSGCSGELKWAFEEDSRTAPTLRAAAGGLRYYKAPLREELSRMIRGERESASNTPYPRRGDVGIITASLQSDALDDASETIQELMMLVALLYPCFVVVDAHEDLVGKKGNPSLQKALCALHVQDYQVRFGVLDCAHYGVPQVRKRSVIIASTNDYPLPKLPSPVTYSPSAPTQQTPIRKISV